MKHLFYILTLTVASTVFAQHRTGIRSNSEEYVKLQESKAKLAIYLTTNKLVYIPGEEIELTVLVTNPTKEVLRVEDPFGSVGSGVRIRDSARPFRYEPDVRASFVVPLHYLITLEPGEQRKQTFFSNRSSLNVVAPKDAGMHTMVFSGYNNAEASFGVVEAELEKAFEFLLPVTRREQNSAIAKEVPTDLYQRVISVRAGQTSRLCLTLGTGPNSLEYSRFDERPGGERRLSKLGAFFGEIRCVAESNSPITTLEATFSNDGTMLLISTSADKSTRKLYVDGQKRVIP